MTYRLPFITGYALSKEEEKELAKDYTAPKTAKTDNLFEFAKEEKKKKKETKPKKK